MNFWDYDVKIHLEPQNIIEVLWENGELEDYKERVKEDDGGITMKKLFLAFITGVALLAGSVCFAAVPSDQMVLGGIRYGASVSEVENMLGRPRKMERETKSYGEKVEYEYSNSLEIKFVNGKAVKIKAEDFSDAKTKAGVGLGTDIATLKKAYGEPDFIDKDDYIYYAADQQGTGFEFEIKNGKVTEIKCGSLH